MKRFAKKCFENIRLNFNYVCRRVGLEGYQVHQILLRDQGLLYIPIPKNACSSIKHTLYEIETGSQYDFQKHKDLGYKDIHDYYQKQPLSFTGVSDLLIDNSFTKFAIIREPLKRLISCYRNRVIDLQDLQETSAKLKLLDLPPKPDINTFILHLKDYQLANKKIAHHSRGQYKFLGNTLRYLDMILPIEKMEDLKGFLRKFKNILELPTKKSGGTSYQLSDLSERALEKAITFYEQDYRLLKNYYSPSSIREEYYKAMA